MSQACVLALQSATLLGRLSGSEGLVTTGRAGFLKRNSGRMADPHSGPHFMDLYPPPSLITSTDCSASQEFAPFPPPEEPKSDRILPGRILTKNIPTSKDPVVCKNTLTVVECKNEQDFP